MFDQILEAASHVFTFKTLIFVILGVSVGQLVGAIPGMTGTMVMAMLMPLSFSEPIWVGIPMLLGILKGALFGGSISAIMLKTPGTPAALATTFDGYPLAKQGKGKKAIKMALISSFFGDAFGTICLILFSGAIASIAIKLGPPEYTLIILSALLLLGTLQEGRSATAGIMSAGFGILLATVGVDPILGVSRFNFDVSKLYSGLELVPLIMGLLTIPEILKEIKGINSNDQQDITKVTIKNEDNKLKWKELKGGTKTFIRSSTIGTIIGAIPGLGSEVAGIVSYNQEVMSSKNPEKYGKGEIKGITAAESANSASGGSDLIPYLSFGIPGDTSIAVIAGAFLVHGISTGPMMFEEHPVDVYAIFIALFLASLMNLIIGQGFTPIITNILKINKSILFPSVIVIAIAGAFSFSQDLFDVGTMVIFGLIGYGMMKLRIPVVPFIIAFILTPMLESQIRRTGVLMSSDNPILFLIQRPLFLILFLAILFMLFLLIKLQRKQKE